MSPSRPVPSAATVPAHPPRRGTDAAKLGLKPPRDSRQELRPKALAKSRPGRADPAASPRHVPSSPLARNVMTFQSTSSGDSNGASKSPLHGIANNRIRKFAASAATGKSADRRHVYSGDTVRIGAPRASKGQRPRAKYQGSPTLPSPSSAGPASSSKPASRSAPACADSRPMYKRKVLEKPKSQPIFKKALANINTLTSMIAKRTTKESKAAILQLPALPSIPTVPNTVSRKPQVQAPAAPIAASCVAKTNVSHPPPTQLQPQSHPRALQPPVPTHSAFPKHAFVTTWISSQVPFATARADRLARGIPPPYASGSGCLIHSPLPFAPPMDNLPEIESDVWSAGDLMDMRMKVQPTVPHVPSDQENWRPDEPVVRGIMSKELVVHAIAKQVEPAAQVPDVDMDEAATILGGDCAGDIGGQQDDAGSQSSERTVIPEEGGDELYSLPGLVSSEKHIPPPKVLARQDSAVMFVPMDVDSPHKAFPVSREYQECPSPLGWAVVPCSDLSMNGLGDEFLQV